MIQTLTKDLLSVSGSAVSSNKSVLKVVNFKDRVQKVECSRILVFTQATRTVGCLLAAMNCLQQSISNLGMHVKPIGEI